jgi:hypothetical protein
MSKPSKRENTLPIPGKKFVVLEVKNAICDFYEFPVITTES